MCDSFSLVKPVILNGKVKNNAALHATLDCIQSRSRVRSIAVDDIYKAAAHVEKSWVFRRRRLKACKCMLTCMLRRSRARIAVFLRALSSIWFSASVFGGLSRFRVSSASRVVMIIP